MPSSPQALPGRPWLPFHRDQGGAAAPRLHRHAMPRAGSPSFRSGVSSARSRNYQLRADEPRIDHRGKPVKYELPRGTQMLLDAHPAIREQLGDPTIPLWITEGIFKADAAISVGLCCIALLGVWNWRGTNGLGGKMRSPIGRQLRLKVAIVYLAFDSDVMTKREVYAALVRLGAFLTSRGAHVHYVYLPSGPGGIKVGLDDYLAAGHAVDDLLALAVT